MVASKSALVAPILMAIAAIWTISAAPSPTIWQPSTWPPLPSYLTSEAGDPFAGFYPVSTAMDPVTTAYEGPGGLRQFWIDHADRCVRRKVDDPGVVFDLDTPGDYEAHTIQHGH